MIFTRNFGALRARTVFPAVTERDEESGRQDDVRFLDENTTRAEKRSVA
jgi:hypothetical protein